jgi:hypothetical protein
MQLRDHVMPGLYWQGGLIGNGKSQPEQKENKPKLACQAGGYHM